MMVEKSVRAASGWVLAAALLTGPAVAQEEGMTAEVAAGVDVASAYIFRGGTVSDEISVQPTLEGTFGCPLGGAMTLGVWGNLNTDVKQFDEVDLYFSYALPLGDIPFGLSLGYTEYTYPTAVDEAGAGLEADREINIVSGYEKGLNDTVTLNLGFSVNIGIDGPYLDEGLYLAAEAGLTQQVTDDFSLNYGAVLGAELGDNYEENGVSHLTLTLGASYRMLSAAVSYVVETDDKVLVVDEDVYGVVSLALPF